MLKQVSLKDVALHSKGKQINGDQLLENGIYDYLNGGINPSGKWNEYNTEANTVTISEGGNSSGFVNFMTNQFWCGAHCYYLHNLKITPKYLYYALKSQEDRIMSLRTGAAMPNIKKSALGEFVFNIDDDSSTQNKVVNVLDNISEMLNKKNQQLSEYDQLIKSRFVEMFGDPVKNTHEWKIENLGFVCDVRDGTHDSPKYINDGYPLITSKNLVEGYIDFTNVNMISKEDLDSINKRSKVDLGDILMPMIGTIGNPIIVKEDKIFAIKNVALIKFKQQSKVINTYIKALLESDYFENAVSSSKRGGTQKFISLGNIRALPIAVPPIELQNEFTAFVQQVDKLKFEDNFLQYKD